MARNRNNNTNSNPIPPEGSSTKFFTLEKIAQILSLVFAGGTLFGAGYWLGEKITEIKFSEQQIILRGEFQEEREQLQKETEQYKIQMSNLPTRQEFDDYKKDIEIVIEQARSKK